MKLDKFTVKQLAEIDACTRCGNCLDLCSAYSGSNDVSISPKKKMGKLKKLIDSEYGIISRILGSLGKRKISKKDIEALSDAAFACTMCSRCEVDCHIGIKLQDLWLKLREILIDEGTYPEVLNMVRERLNKSRNISFDTNEGRANWTSQLEDIPENKFVKQRAEVIYFVGCVSSFSPRVFKIPRSVVKILQAADVDFGLLGDEEWCCGFPLLTSGFKNDFLEFAEHNIQRINSTGAKYLITSCPSCYHMWKHLYGGMNLKLKMDFEIMHEVQYIYRLAKEGKLKLNPMDFKVTYHDPCDLGRNSRIYDEPRNLIKMIPGVEFTELEKTKEYATCCGGGGNVEAVDIKLSEDIAKIKAKEVINSGADIVITACQQCVRTILQALKKEGSKIKVMDISELVLASLQQNTKGS
ncbi:MAG: (Fe-S)-binding protein [Actinobacteria bacterium]|nr:(Fe-S)-binding protein [Actinomycetota bacterium]MBM3711945.1 (Fe-S)-binding protein [Actinomycetota bacterium]